MVSRPYKCSLCHSVFRDESGMKWHIAHGHEIPAAFDALGKDYEAKTLKLQEENSMLRKNLEEIKTELDRTRMTLLQERGERADDLARIVRLNQDIQKAANAIVARDFIIKERLGIQMPNPFE
jgi:peptidoglycan hydrolase CwlO-like protein